MRKLSSQAIEVVKLMDVLNAIRSKRVNEDGGSFRDTQGNVGVTIMANRSGKGTQSLMTKHVIMREYTP